MAKRKSAHNEQTWNNAKKLCRLNDRQVSMARALGMNPKKLPGLRPSPHQKWKLPVGAFIEACYAKRFGETRPFQESSSQLKVQSLLQADNVRETAMMQVGSLVCYLLNLSEDLKEWLEHGTITPEVLAEIREELSEIAKALETGTAISEMPSISRMACSCWIFPRSVKQLFAKPSSMPSVTATTAITAR